MIYFTGASSTSTARRKSSVKTPKTSNTDALAELQGEVLKAELSRIETEKRKLELETEVLLLKKQKLMLELEKMKSLCDTFNVGK